MREFDSSAYRSGRSQTAGFLGGDSDVTDRRPVLDVGSTRSDPTRARFAGSMVDSPQWTDFNDSDPGISLLELLAFLATGYLVMTGLGPLLERTGLVKRVVIVNVDGESWRLIENLDDVGPDARVFRLDPVSGSIEFGDGEHGRIPSGSVSTSSRYRYGAGAGGAIAAIVVLCGVWSLSIWRRLAERSLCPTDSRHLGASIGHGPDDEGNSPCPGHRPDA